MSNQVHKYSLLAVLLVLTALPFAGFGFMSLETSQGLNKDVQVLGATNIISDSSRLQPVDAILINLKLNGSEKQVFYDVIPKKYLSNHSYSLDYEFNESLKLSLEKDSGGKKINLHVNKLNDKYNLDELNVKLVILK